MPSHRAGGEAISVCTALYFSLGLRYRNIQGCVKMTGPPGANAFAPPAASSRQYVGTPNTPCATAWRCSSTARADSRRRGLLSALRAQPLIRIRQPIHSVENAKGA
jgi:hypothetical protein